MAFEQSLSAVLILSGCDAQAQNLPAMAKAMGLAAEAGRLAIKPGRISVEAYASASSSLTGVVS